MTIEESNDDGGGDAGGNVDGGPGVQTAGRGDKDRVEYNAYNVQVKLVKLGLKPDEKSMPIKG